MISGFEVYSINPVTAAPAFSLGALLRRSSETEPVPDLSLYRGVCRVLIKEMANLPDRATSSIPLGWNTVTSRLHFVGQCNRYRDLMSGFDRKLIY